jgi:hypothetical protein
MQKRMISQVKKSMSMKIPKKGDRNMSTNGVDFGETFLSRDRKYRYHISIIDYL